jgi:ubiquinone/menaquinone biosynthesis C-methylase UbiE
LKKFLPGVRGKVVDVGAGQSPYKHLLDADVAQYVGLDIRGADNFGYNNPEIVHFDGRHIPLESDSIDALLCTEVLEHVEDAQELIDEMHRILKPGGRGVLTIPWSARYHYIPYDYHRFTPSRLKIMFSAFSSASVQPRGTDITAIVSKSIVVYLRYFNPKNKLWLPISLLAAFVGAPIVLGAVLLGHASIQLKIGSTDDPLGYTVWVEK